MSVVAGSGNKSPNPLSWRNKKTEGHAGVMGNSGSCWVVVGSELGWNAGLTCQRLFARLHGFSRQMLRYFV